MRRQKKFHCAHAAHAGNGDSVRHEGNGDSVASLFFASAQQSVIHRAYGSIEDVPILIFCSSNQGFECTTHIIIDICMG